MAPSSAANHSEQDADCPAAYLNRIDQARRRGDLLLAFDTAWSGVKIYADNLDLKYQAVLALARTGAYQGAEALYQRWQLEQQPNEDFQALAGRLLKDRALRASGAERAQLALQAASRYENVWLNTHGYYPAINTATLYQLGGQPERAQQFARTVLKALDADPQQDYFQAASRAEAELILGNLNALQNALNQAASLRGDDWHLGSITRNQLLLLCDALQLPSSLLDPLRPPSCAHFCGHIIGHDDSHPRFPASREAAVRAQMDQLIKQHNIGFGFGSAAAGADLIFAEAMLDHGGEIHLVLPFDQQEFIQTSVASSGPQWLPRFERCIKAAEQAGTLFRATRDGYQQDNQLFAYASHIAMGSAHLLAAQLGSSLIEVAVWDGVKGKPGAGTWGDISRWRSHGGDTLVINSHDPAQAVQSLSSIPHQDSAEPHSGTTQSSAGQPPAAAPSAAPASSQNSSTGPLPDRELRALLFGDIKGFTQLREDQLPAFQQHVMGSFARVLDQHRDHIQYRNTWGDALYVVFEDVSSAATCGAQLQQALRQLPLAELNLPQALALRIGMHYGPVYQGRDEVLRQAMCYGTEVSRAARIEPITPPGEIYATEAFAAALAFDAGDSFCADYVGRVQTAKNYGEFRMYHIRASGCD